MSTTQQILQAMSSLQSNAQSSLPVIPNNGNPGGANNMPQETSASAPPQAASNPYQWLEPSPAVASTNQLLADMAAKLRRDMYNESLSEGKYQLIPHADGSTQAQLLTNTGDDFDPYNLDRRLPVIPINMNQGIENNAVPALPRGP